MAGTDDAVFSRELTVAEPERHRSRVDLLDCTETPPLALRAVASAAVPPKVTVKTGLSLSIMRLQIRFTGRIISGLNRNEPTKTIASNNRNKLGKIID